MTSLTKTSKDKKKKNRPEFVVRNTEKFELESFSFPVDIETGEMQEFPTNEYIVKTFAVYGAIGIGKTNLTKNYFGNRIKKIWGDDVDFFFAKDLWATIEAIKYSKKLVHYLIIDDAIRFVDSRRSMSSKNVDMTNFYFEIRHELEDYAIETDGNAGGLVIIAIVAQDYKAIDKRLRNALAFNVFKSYDEACEEGKNPLIPDKKIIRNLMKMKDKTVRCSDNFWKKLSIAVDAERHYTIFFTDLKKLSKIEFKYVTGVDIFERQQNKVIEYLIENFNLEEMDKDSLKAELHFEVDRMKKLDEKCRISKSDFSEIIIRAKRLQEIRFFEIRQKKAKELQELIQKSFENQRNQIIDYLVNNLNLELLNKDSIRAEILFTLDKIIKKENQCFISKRDFSEIIIRAKRIQEKNRKENFWKERNDIHLLILHDTFSKSFEEISQISGIPQTTAYRNYINKRNILENSLRESTNKDFEIIKNPN